MLFALSYGNLRLRGATELILQMMRGRGVEKEDGDWEGVLASGGLNRTRYQVGDNGGGGRNGYCPNSSNF